MSKFSYFLPGITRHKVVQIRKVRTLFLKTDREILLIKEKIMEIIIVLAIASFVVRVASSVLGYSTIVDALSFDR